MGSNRKQNETKQKSKSVISMSLICVHLEPNKGRLRVEPLYSVQYDQGISMY